MTRRVGRSSRAPPGRPMDSPAPRPVPPARMEGGTYLPPVVAGALGALVSSSPIGGVS